jgi:putative SOS response-associated peptidase YedK
LSLLTGSTSGKKRARGKQPVYICRKDAQPFAFAGLWEEWEREGEVIDSCTIITTEANDLVSVFHDRMPVILNPRDYDLWLDPSVQDPNLLEPLLRPYPSGEMEVYPVSRVVNDPRNETPKCVEPENTLL